MLQEVIYTQAERPDERPPALGRTWIASSSCGGDPAVLLSRIREAWLVIAGWGRWCDEELGEWPSTERCLASLPEWLASALASEETFEVENWLDTLHERDWIWWSSDVVDSVIKIDTCAFSEPSSTWPLDYVLNSSGANIIIKCNWISLDMARYIIKQEDR